MNTKTTPKKRLTKRMYVFLAFVTMAAVHLFAKPIKRGISLLLTKSANQKPNLRSDLEVYSRQQQKQAIKKSPKKYSRSA